jgi:hypothetical protein
LSPPSQGEDRGVGDKHHEEQDASCALVLLWHKRGQRNGSKEQSEEQREVDDIEPPIAPMELGAAQHKLIFGHRSLSLMPNA